jgi:uncharacterized protein
MKSINIDDAPKDCIRTNSGLFVNVFEPTPDMFVIEDIAHALSRIPRFGGHMNRHYSVAQHCVMATNYVNSLVDKRELLLHDASEAYILDMPTPIKNKMPEYKKIEDRIMSIIFEKYDLKWPMNQTTKEVDRLMLLLEWENLIIGDKPEFICWSPDEAKEKFIDMYNQLFI